MTTTATSLDLGDIQGDILRAYGNAYGRTSYVFVTIRDPTGGRDWLRAVTDRVMNATPWPGAEKPPCAWNVAFTAPGLAALGVPERVLRTFSDEFLEGMELRAEVLGDTAASAPEHWDAGLRHPHVLVTLNALGERELQTTLTELRTEVVRHGLEIAHEEHAHTLDGAREHFGFADGFAQPAIEGATDDRAEGGGVPLRAGRWRALAPGEFILGYPDEDTRVDPQGRLPSAPASPLGRNGTYMVWRKLRQDVALFRRTVAAAAAHYAGGDERLLRAKVVGRWEDGAPLVTHPIDPGAFDATAPGANAFLYAEDADGRRCPLGAHVRRSNPRDALGFEGRLSFRHRIIRRGMPYGEPLAEGVLEDDGADRGLVFVCFNASISRQFEGIQVQWLNDGNVFGLGHDRDWLLGGDNGGSMVVPGKGAADPPFYLAPQGPFVTTRGGDYLFVPGLTALGAIADGVTG